MEMRFFWSVHIKGPKYLTVLEKHGQLLCNFSELRHSYKESWAFCVRIPTFKQSFAFKEVSPKMLPSAKKNLIYVNHALFVK